MLRKTMAGVDIKTGLQLVLNRIDEVYAKRPKEIVGRKPLLVAVGKTKPAEMIIEAYTAGQRHFGENYVQELVEKSTNPLLRSQCPDIAWHFIGRLQTNKINKVINIPNLYMIQSVHGKKLADSLNAAWEKVEKENKKPLRVLVQVNSSREEVKSGVDPSEALGLYKYIRDNLKNLQLDGLMTIGKYGHDYSTGPNVDFIALMECQRQICNELNLDPSAIEISMGMSNDYDRAIDMGSTIVRVGSSIFGERTVKKSS